MAATANDECADVMEHQNPGIGGDAEAPQAKSMKRLPNF
jgi:hypothetical protein